MKIPTFFMGKIIVTLFLLADNPCGMKPSVTMSSVLLRHPSSTLNSRKVPKMPCFCGFYGVGSNEPNDEPSGFKRRGKIKLYQRRSYYARRKKPAPFRFRGFRKSRESSISAGSFLLFPIEAHFDGAPNSARLRSPGFVRAGPPSSFRVMILKKELMTHEHGLLYLYKSSRCRFKPCV